MAEEELTKKQEEIQNEIKQKPMQTLLKIMSIIGFFILIIVLIIVKVSIPTFPIGWIIVIGIFGFIVVIIIYNAFKIPKLFKRVLEGKTIELPLPTAITQQQIDDRVYEIITSPKYANYVGVIKNEKVEEHGKGKLQKIYSLYFEGVYNNRKGEKIAYLIAINLHYPTTNFTVLKNPTVSEMIHARKTLPTHPEDQPDTEITETENPMLGTKQIVKRTTRPKPIVKEIKKEGDFK